MSRESTYEGFFPYVVLFFFLNNVFMPEGLLYTTLLSPVFIYWIYKNHKLGSFLKWSLLLLIPIPFQLISGFDAKIYLLSTTLIITAWIFFHTAIIAVKTLGGKLEDMFLKVLIINFVLLIIALLFLPFSPLRELFWSSIPISHNIPGFPRLKMLAYEPSHYALLLSPVFLFFLSRIISVKTKHTLLLLIAIGLPLLLSFSFGVMGAMFIAMVIGIVSFLHVIRMKRFLVYGFILMAAVMILIGIFWPENPALIRLDNILSGTDTSAKGRLFDSFMFATDLIRQNNIIFGVGPGQVKVLAHDLIINYYQYSGEFSEIVRIPNSMAEMLATYGIYGFLLKLGLEIFFFIRLKIYRNLYTLILFIFMFIYQFTGSFLVNVAELGIWAMVFNSRFCQFDYQHLKSESA